MKLSKINQRLKKPIKPFKIPLPGVDINRANSGLSTGDGMPANPRHQQFFNARPAKA